jgi:hypothetical protein
VQLGDRHRLIPDPFQMEAAVQYGGHESQLCGDRRLQREHLQHPVVDTQVQLVDGIVIPDHDLGAGAVSLHQRRHGALDGSGRELTHREQLELHAFELLVEVLSRHPNLPVT